MAEINAVKPARNGRRAGLSLPVLRLDMTPMVDLAFLLLTFFILASTLSLSRSVEVSYPKETGTPRPLNKRLAHTFLVGEKDGQVYYYKGEFRPDSTRLQKVGLDHKELDELIGRENQEVFRDVCALKKKYRNKLLGDSVYQETMKHIKTENPNAPVFIIRTLDKTKYQNLVTLLQQLNSHEALNSVLDMTEEEREALDKEEVKKES